MDKRIQKARQILKDQKCDAFLITSPAHIVYLTGYTNFSIEEREAFIFLTATNVYILTDGRYTTAIKEKVPHMELYEISAVNPFRNALKDLITKHTIKSLGVEENNLTVSEYKTLQSMNIADIRPAKLHLLRIQKTSDEIRAIQKACEIGDKAFRYILKQFKQGVTEKDIAKELQLYIQKQNAELSFPSIVAFGSHAAIPHHQTSDRQLTTHDLILLDFGVKLDSYCSDMTRTVFFGKATDEQKRMYQTVHDAQQLAVQTLNSGFLHHNSENKTVLASDIDKAAREYILYQGYPSIPHSLGHGIGLQVHEPPTLSPVSHQVLAEGMVFSIEPGIYIPSYGGVRIEDLFIIENHSLRQLTQSSRDLIEL